MPKPVFTTGETPLSSAKLNQLADYVDEAVAAAPGGEGGGHVIYDENGDAMEQRAGLRFDGDSVEVEDVEINDETRVTLNHKADAVHSAAQPVMLQLGGVNVALASILDFTGGDNVTLEVEPHDPPVEGKLLIRISSAINPTVWRVGAGPPSNSLGVSGDLYLNTSNGDVYRKSGSAYAVVSNFKGPQGATGLQGAQGPAGSQIYTAAGDPDNANGLNGDIHLNATSGDVFKKSAGAWALEGNILGPQGPQGPTGPQGPAGVGDVTGPGGGSTDNRVARWDGTGGDTLQDSPLGVGDDGTIYVPEIVTPALNPAAGRRGLFIKSDNTLHSIDSSGNTAQISGTGTGGGAFAGCRVFNSANINVPSPGSGAFLTFNSESYDSDSYHSTSSDTSRLTVPVGKAGVYTISAYVHWDANSSGTRQLAVRKNGTTYILQDSRTATADAMGHSIVCVAQLAEGDYVELRCYQTSNSNINVLTNDGSPSFAMHMV